MIPLWYVICLSFGAAYLGFWVGRSRNWAFSGGISMETEDLEQVMGSAPEPKRQILPSVRYLASPTGGKVEQYPVGGRPGVKILTSESKLYSPTAGRVLWIAPRGNSFLIMTDWGDEVEVRACNSEDDLLDRYFRPRVIKGEIIRRGKLLLEYDREKLSRECDDTAVYLMAKGEENGKLELAAPEEVKAGDALFWVG